MNVVPVIHCRCGARLAAYGLAPFACRCGRIHQSVVDVEALYDRIADLERAFVQLAHHVGRDDLARETVTGMNAYQAAQRERDEKAYGKKGTEG